MKKGIETYSDYDAQGRWKLCIRKMKQGACWVQRGEEYYCSHCGGTAPMDINRKHTVTTKFCPHCGYRIGR